MNTKGEEVLAASTHFHPLPALVLAAAKVLVSVDFLKYNLGRVLLEVLILPLEGISVISALSGGPEVQNKVGISR